MRSLQEFVAFDLETTGLSADTDSLIEIGAVRVRGQELGERFSAVVKPRTAVSPLSSLLTGITAEELAGGEDAPEALRAFLEFAGTLPLVAHNADFDATFLKAELKRAGMEPPLFEYFDSLVLVRMAWPLWPNHKMETVAARLELPQGRGHRALPDAEWAAMAWLRAEAVLQANTAFAPTLEALLLSAPQPWNRLASSPERLAFPSEGIGGDQGQEQVAWPQPQPAFLGRAASPPAEGWWKSEGALHQALRDLHGDAGTWPERLLSEFHKALSDGRWCSLECSDPRAYAMALASAAAHGIRSGKGVLLVVPDARAEDALVGAAQAAVRSALGQDWRLQVLREPDGYISPSRLQDVGGRLTTRFTASERLALMPILSWGVAAAHGDIVAFPGASADRGRPLGLKITAGGYGSDEPFAHAAHQRAQNAEVVVVRYETFLRDLELDGALIPQADGVVFLEAHRLPEVMDAMAGRELSFFKVRHILHTVAVSPEEPQGLAAWLAALTQGAALPEALSARLAALAETSLQAEKQTQRWLSKIGRQAEKRVKSGETRLRYRERLAVEFAAPEAPVLELLQTLQEDLHALAAALAAGDLVLPAALNAGEAALAASECTRAASRLGESRTLITRLANPSEEEVAWVEEFQNPHKIRIRSRSLNSAAAFAEKLSALHRGGIWLSPTLSLGDGTQRQFSRRSGLAFLDPAPKYITENPAAGERRFFLAPFAPSPQGADSAKPLGELLARSLAKIVLPTAIFAPSQNLVRALREGLQRLLPDRCVIAQGLDGNRDALAYLFRHAKAPILLGQDWPSHLADAEGQPLRLLVIARIPFAPPSDPMIAARSEMAQQEGKHALFDVLVPEAALRIKELLQRQRQPGLRQAAWLLDPRAARERYGHFLVRGVAESTVIPQESDLLAATEEWLAG